MTIEAVHIRSNAAPFAPLCGRVARETISHGHYVAHVYVFGADCCAALYQRLCPACKSIADQFRRHGARHGAA